jgi:hypothetical protein
MGFEDFSLALGRLSATVNVAIFAQNCQICHKQNFEIPPKIEI